MHPKFKMKEITQSTGISKSTVLYYLSLGLLPSPLKTSKNMAYYPSSYVDILPVIRYLQDNMRLPLGVIKQIIGGIGFENFSIEHALHYYETFLNPAKHGEDTASYNDREFEAHAGLSPDEISELLRNGLLFSSDSGSYYSDDLLAAIAYRRLKDVGIDFSDLEKFAGGVKNLTNDAHELYHATAKGLNPQAEKELTGVLRKEFETVFHYLFNKNLQIIYKEENT